MVRAWIFLLIVLGIIGFLIYRNHKNEKSLPSKKFSPITKSNETWAQLYETDSWDEITGIRLRLAEENLDAIIFEQGKRDSQGNILKKFGIITPKGHLSRGQSLLARFLS